MDSLIGKLKRMEPFVKKLAHVSTIQFIAPDDPQMTCAIKIAENIEIMMPIRGLIDIKPEIVRQKNQLERLQKNLTVLSDKLDNLNFLKKAPEPIVARERERLNETRLKIKKINQWITLLTKDMNK